MQHWWNMPHPFSIADSVERLRMSGRSFVRAASVCAVLASPVVAMAAGGPRTLSPAFDQAAYIHPQRLVAVGAGVVDKQLVATDMGLPLPPHTG
jgi:hypothetical protein